MAKKPARRRPPKARRAKVRASDAVRIPRAKVFWTGRSQAVRLPKEFRFETDTVLVRRDGDRVILEPDRGWPDGWLDWLASGPHVGPDFKRWPQGKSRRVVIFP